MSFQGFVSSAYDAALLIYASQEGYIPSISSRLTTVQREAIQSGDTFVFHETESGMKRWTDGYRWTKSRVEGHFLVYRRLEKSHIGDDILHLLPSNKKGESFQLTELCKRTFSMNINGDVSHVINYYNSNHALKTPSEMFDLKVPIEYQNPANYCLSQKSWVEPLKRIPTPEPTLCVIVDNVRYFVGMGESLESLKRIILNKLNLPETSYIRLAVDRLGILKPENMHLVMEKDVVYGILEHHVGSDSMDQETEAAFLLMSLSGQI